MAFRLGPHTSRTPARAPHRAAQPVRGIILRQDADQLVVRPTDADVAAFGSGLAVEVRPQVGTCTRARGHDGPCNGTDCGTSRAAVDWRSVMADGLYDRHGRRVAFVTDIEQSHENYDMTGYADNGRRYVRGPMRVRIRAEGIGE